MNISSSTASHADFFAMREAAAMRMQTAKQAPATNMPLTTPVRQSDPVMAAQSARGPIKGRLVDFIA